MTMRSLSGWFYCPHCRVTVRGLEQAVRHECQDQPEEQPEDPPEQSEGPDHEQNASRDFWQRFANAQGQVVLVIPHRCPKLCAEGPSLPYGVTEDQANAWEKSNAIMRIQPQEEVR